ncbi:hypothetical protein Bhyg_08006 [Pseudolycoriella hygida]|uniref:Integrase zinc-binding domain-containing protein n=1 Tax=Pseudolycoriella hygida TaxID=35572 RepID=A0A9Q0S4I1_9DIPT|nr:hypothetical protein Bhyg_08006 [Pseudolycoriella hygida]
MNYCEKVTVTELKIRCKLWDNQMERTVPKWHPGKAVLIRYHPRKFKPIEYLDSSDEEVVQTNNSKPNLHSTEKGSDRNQPTNQIVESHPIVPSKQKKIKSELNPRKFKPIEYLDSSDEEVVQTNNSKPNLHSTEKGSDRNQPTNQIVETHPIYVAFRIGEILELTNIEDWRWVPSKDNVADEATKWTKKPEISSSCRWFIGPDFLRDHNNWEMDWTNFERAQFDHLGEEVAILRWNKMNPLKQPKSLEPYGCISQCCPYIDDDDLLGRIDAVPNLSLDSRRPIILPKQHRITFLIVGWHHRKMHHGNHETVVNELRQRFYVPRIRVVLKTMVTRCQHCKNKRARPVVPAMADLPAARLTPYSRPFLAILDIAPVLQTSDNIIPDGRELTVTMEDCNGVTRGEDVDVATTPDKDSDEPSGHNKE